MPISNERRLRTSDRDKRAFICSRNEESICENGVIAQSGRCPPSADRSRRSIQGLAFFKRRRKRTKERRASRSGDQTHRSRAHGLHVRRRPAAAPLSSSRGAHPHARTRRTRCGHNTHKRPPRDSSDDRRRGRLGGRIICSFAHSCSNPQTAIAILQPCGIPALRKCFKVAAMVFPVAKVSSTMMTDLRSVSSPPAL